MNDTKVLPVSPNVSWIGVLDPGLVTFDVVMETRYGTTYNSFFINAEKKTVIETVKARFCDTWLEKIRQIADPASIEYIVLNHTEPDHSGSLGELLTLAPNAKVVGTGNAIRYLTDQLGFEFPHVVVKDGHTLDLGNYDPAVYRRSEPALARYHVHLAGGRKGTCSPAILSASTIAMKRCTMILPAIFPIPSATISM